MTFSSDALLLSTKIKIPVPRKNYIVRRGLFEQLSQCTDMSVIFVRGGAGTGKTTLLASYIYETKLKNICWMAIDNSNSNIYTFWLYFTAAVSVFLEDDDFLKLMRANSDASQMEHLLIMLINQLCSEEDYYIVLDDVHYIADAALIRTFEFFVNAMPSNFHIFMLSREDPPLYLGTLAVSGRLLFIDGKQMQLLPEEGMAFLKDTLHLTSNDEDLTRLNTYAEGWIGGLQLAAAAGASDNCANQLLRAGGGIAVEYLTRELFETLTPEEQDFLIKTSILSYFNVEICTKLLENFTKMDFDRIVESLIQRNLFVICVDEQSGIFRYHNILSDYLMQHFKTLHDEYRKEICNKAADVFEQIQDYEEALHQYCMAENYDDVLRVVRKMGGRIEAWSYLDQVPIDQIILDPDLAFQCFMYNCGVYNLERLRLLFEKFKEHYKESDYFNIVKFAETYIFRNEGVLPQYHQLTADQIEHLHLGSVAKGMKLVGNSMALMELMQYEEAEKCINRAIQMCSEINNFVTVFAYNQLAQIYEETGRLNDCLTCYTKSRDLLNSPSMMTGIGTNYYIGSAGVYMRRMELDKAAKMLEQAQSLIETQRISLNIMDITLSYHLAEMKFLYGDNAAGAAYVEEIASEYSLFSVLTLGRLIHELDCAEKLPPEMASAFLKELDTAKNYQAQPFMRLLRARLLSKRGKTDEALRETDEVLTFSRIHNNKLRLVEAGLLKIFILVHSQANNSGQREINNIMKEAIHYACENRIIMPFYLDRLTFLPVLYGLFEQATSKNSMSASEMNFIRDIIEVSGHPIPIPKRHEILSVRELEVLNEMSMGLTNREIAEKLCISQATVKTHVLSIFNKLGVSSRMMAVDKGRKKGILQ